MRTLEVLSQYPFLSWSKEEKDALPNIIHQLNKIGAVVVLGEKRCFMCGVELEGGPLEIEVLQRGPKVGVIMNLCGNCQALAKLSQRTN